MVKNASECRWRGLERLYETAELLLKSGLDPKEWIYKAKGSKQLIMVSTTFVIMQSSFQEVF